MEVGSALRRKCFWAADKILLHGEYRRFYNETEKAYLEETDAGDVDKKLEKLLSHAADTTKFYAAYKGVTELNRFPVINKIQYQQKPDEFVSSAYKNVKCHKHSTSGSTGVPLEILYSPEKGRKRYGTSIFLNTLADYNIGDRQAYARVWSKNYQKSFLEQKAMNLIPIETTYLDKEHLQEICATLVKKRVTSLAGHASALSQLCFYIRDNNIDCSKFRLKSITPGSEPMTPYVREELKKMFHCPVCQIYGAEEFGTIGMQMKDSYEYYVDTSSVFLEVFKMDEDVPAEEGEPGRLIVTDLYSFAFPIIRYENGDIVASRKERLPDGRYRQYFTEIYGRRADLIYSTDGRTVAPMLLSNKMQACTDMGIIQWKFVQSGEKTYFFEINGDSRRVDEQFIRGLILDDIGQDAEISFRYVDNIPVLNSGKRKYVENQWRRNA